MMRSTLPSSTTPLIVLTALLNCLATPAAGQRNPSPAKSLTLTPAQVAARALPAVAEVFSLTASGDTLRSGSGFLVDANGTFITNYHVVEGGHRLGVRLRTGEIFDGILFLSADPRRDVVLLKIPLDQTPFVPLSTRSSMDVGESVYVVGNPLGLEGTFSDGVVSSVRVVEGTEYVQITAPISPGSSGGPVLDSRGEVIGVATLSVQGGQNLNLAVPTRYIRPMISLAPAPVSFEAAQVPPRHDPERVTRTARFVSVTDPVGTYRMTLQTDDPSDATFSGRLLLAPQGGSYWAAGWYRLTLASSAQTIGSPVTVTRDGRVAMNIDSEVEGGFVDEEHIMLATAGESLSEAPALLVLTSNADVGAISTLEGVYTIEGQGRFLTGSAQTLMWNGVCAFLDTDMQHQNGKGRLVIVYVDVSNSRSGSVGFTTTAAVDPVGRIAVDPVVWEGGDSPSTDMIQVVVRAGQVEMTIEEQHHNRADRILDRRIQLTGGKYRP